MSNRGVFKHAGTESEAAESAVAFEYSSAPAGWLEGFAEPALMRTDPTGGYTEDNVEVVCKAVAILAEEIEPSIGGDGLDEFAKRIVTGTETKDDIARVNTAIDHHGMNDSAVWACCRAIVDTADKRAAA